MKKQYGMLLCFAIAVTAAEIASARVSPTLREGTRNNWFAFSIGPSIALLHSPNQLLMEQTYGHHFSRDASGPAIALDLQEHVAGGMFVLQTGPRFVYDIRIVRGLGLYLAPSVGFEYTFSTGGPHNGFSVPFLFKVKLVLANRGLVFFQPVGIDLMALFRPDNSYVALQYDLMFGGGVIF
jgi:hypothetical protein